MDDVREHVAETLAQAVGAQPAQLGRGVAHAGQAFLAVALRLPQVSQRVGKPLRFVSARGDFLRARSQVVQLSKEVLCGIRRAVLQ